ncbi:MAG: hypothetical protein GOV15_00660 [Candidatus Diapherotrites archaeon]|nr:hypothetical protein [Candidatus Diapherotrites archaeon]
MSSDAENSFVVFIQSHPELNPVAQDAVAVSLLKAVEGKGMYVADLLRKFPSIGEHDLLSKLAMMEKIRFVARLELLHGILYYQTDASHEFLQLYIAAKGSFKV